ncbi:hypothetical protein [Actinoplanes flavus]|uniref:PKD domain-containing protein n=1 Tax=Actinoplanes flavus TaxID=2820290 RepID=A0ABS3UDF0_9ACTN|nr:hypothetical protein [Actinoplanes flavus]MBO3736763.1 hypothetical protein [Actinoplanes flavus]
MHRTVRALLSAAVAALSATTVLAGLPAAPAQAATYGSLPLTAWSYTDRAQPATPNPNPAGDFLIGSTEEHTGRAYFTFDLTPLKGQVLHRVTFNTSERTVNDCSRVAPIEVWRTRKVTETTTWQHPPKELELLAERSFGKGGICPGAYLGIDMIPAIQAAFARGEKKLTIEVRVDAAAEGDTGVGRTMAQAKMSYAANHAPRISGLKLAYPDAGCGTLERHPTAGSWMRVQATVTDADPNDYPQTVYAYWPVDRPDQRKESLSQSLNLSGIEDGTVVAWTAQGRDYDDAGPWGRTCYFTVDTVAPATTPVVSSKKYPSEDYPGTGGPGVPGTFVFDAAGDADIVGFDWSPMDGTAIERVTANHPGGRAKITITPRTWGLGRIEVAARDAAGNRGPWVQYRYQIRNTAPTALIEMNGVGLTSHITLSSRIAEVTAFGYAVDGGPETRVPAVDGKGEDDLVFTSTGHKTVLARAYAGNRMIGSDSVQIHVTDAPKVTSAEFDWSNEPIEGVAGSFTFAPRTTGVVSYRYGFGDGVQHSVDARADGTAVLDWTPERGGHFTITVYSVDGAGNRSQATEKSFSVISARPTVDVESWGAHVGDPINVRAWSDLPNAAGIVYSFDGGPPRTVDGTYAFFQVVPAHSGDSVLKVWAKLADGTLSPPTEEVIHLADAPKVTAQGPFGAEAVMGRPVSFTFTAAQQGATTFRYEVGGVQHTVPAGPDGTATVTYEVPGDAGDATVAVASLTPDGTVSDTTTFWVPVRNPNVEVFNPWPADLPPGDAMGGPGIPGQFGFFAYDLSEVTTKFLWSVDDGPVQEVLYDPWSWETVASYTPEHAGDHTLHVQREFTDGSRSPLLTVPFTVGNEVAPA